MADLTGGKGSHVWDRPLLGYYRSDDPAVIAAHCAWARAAGIDVLLQSCFQGLSPTLLEEAAKAGIQVAPYLEFSVEKQHPSTQEPAGDKKYDYFMRVARTIARQAQERPEAVYTIDQKPVIFAYKRTLDEPSTPAFWAEALLRLKAEGLEFIILGDMSPTVATIGRSPEARALASTWMRIFDGMHSYHVLFLMRGNPDGDTVQQRCEDLYEQELKILGDRRRISCLTVMPGWDNRTVNDPGMVVDRRNGAVYEGMWKAVLKQNGPDLVMATSFNEWMEGGTIEPSFSTGTRYLELTRSYSARFRGQPQQDRQVTLVWKRDGLRLVIPSGTEVASTGLKGYPSPIKDDPAVDLLEIVEGSKGVASLGDEQQKPENAPRTQLSTGTRATSSARNPWYDGQPWNGRSGDWYYRFDGTRRVEAVFGCHHLIVFLDGRIRALADGVAVELAYPPTWIADRKSGIGTVLVPLSLLVTHLGIPLDKRVESAKIRPAEPATRPEAAVRMQADAKLQEEWHPRLVAKVSARVGAGKRIQLAKDSEMVVISATLTELTVIAHDQQASLPWRAVTPLQKAEMLLRTAGDPDAESLLIAAVYYVAAGRPTSAQECLFKASATDKAAADALGRRMQERSPAPGKD